jgi:Transcriptional regulator
MGRPPKITDEQILQGARSVFLARGPAVATAEIADSLGVSQATLFNRFGSKRALLIEALRPRENDTLLAMLDRDPDDRPVPIQLEEIGLAIAAQCARVDPAVTMLRAAGVPRSDLFPPGTSSPLNVVRHGLQGWLERARDAGLIAVKDPATTAAIFLGALHHRPFDAHKPAEAKGEVAAIVQALWLGLCPRSVAK